MAVTACLIAAQPALAPRSLAGESVPEMISDLEKQKVSPRLVTRLVELQAAEARPALEHAFDRATNKLDKQSLAAGLSALGAEDRRFVHYLLLFAKPAAENDMPFPFLIGPDGSIVPGSYLRNESFMDWCVHSGIDPGAAMQKAVYEDPMDIRFLAMAKNSEAAAVLLRALGSSNWIVSVAAAEGLAALGKPEYFDPVLAAAKLAPRELGVLFARSVLQFDSKESERAAKALVPDPEMFNALLRERKMAQPQ